MLIQKNITANNYQNKNSKTNFKGHTIPPIEIWTSTGYSLSGPGGYVSGYKVPKEATPNYPGAYPNKHTKIYKAAPFEIISDETYKTHDYTIRDDLRLSQIKKDYKKGYMNFASNAWNEKEFINNKHNEAITKIEENKYYIDEYQKRKDFTSKETLKQKYTDKINKHQEGLTYHTNQEKILSSTLKTTQERFELLKALDDKMGEIHNTNKTIIKTYEDIEQNKNHTSAKKNIQRYIEEAKNIKATQAKAIKDVEKQFPVWDVYKISDEKAAVRAKYDNQLARIKNAITNTCKKIAQGKADIPKLLKKCENLKQQIPNLYKELDNCMANVEKLYKAKYPHWL